MHSDLDRCTHWHSNLHSMCGHGSDLIVVWVHIGMKAILSLCGMHMGLTTIVSLCRCVWAETAIASLYWCVQEERSYRCAGMCIGIDRIDIGVYSHYTCAEAVRDSEEGVSESTTDPAPTTPPLPPPRHAEEMVRVSGQELDNIIRCLNYNVDIGMHSFSLSKAATEQFEEHKNKIRKLQHDFERYLIY